MNRNRLTWFRDQMQRKLNANAHKGDWRNESFRYLLRRLKQETAELQRRLPKDGDAWLVKQAKEIVQEAADVANFAFMIADIADLFEEDTPDER